MTANWQLCTCRPASAGRCALASAQRWPAACAVVRLLRGAQAGHTVSRRRWGRGAGAGARNQRRAPGAPHPCGGDLWMDAEIRRHAGGAAWRAYRQDRTNAMDHDHFRVSCESEK